MQYTYFLLKNTARLTTRGGTSPNGVEMTLIREYKPSENEAKPRRLEGTGVLGLPRASVPVQFGSH